MKPAFRFGLRRWWRLRFGWQWFRGDYASWAGARAASAGYDDQALLDRVVTAMREVAAGRARYERDGVAFPSPEVNAPLLARLRASAAQTGGRLDVVDFGGSLGSLWWQHRSELAQLAAVRWRVVEQAHYVAAGREFAQENLDFADSIAAALQGMQPAVIILSSVLPYLENPGALLAEAVRHGFAHIIIDRTPFIAGGRTRLAVQHTPPGLGGGSYPCWLFDREKLLSVLQPAYELVAEWPSLDELAPHVRHRGFHFQRRR